MELTSPHEHIKNKPTRGTILTKNWKLAERLLYNHGCKKRYTEVHREAWTPLISRAQVDFPQAGQRNVWLRLLLSCNTLRTAMLCSPARAERMLQPCSRHATSVVLELAWPGSGKRLDLEMER